MYRIQCALYEIVNLMLQLYSSTVKKIFEMPPKEM